MFLTFIRSLKIFFSKLKAVIAAIEYDCSLKCSSDLLLYVASLVAVFVSFGVSSYAVADGM